MAQALPSSVPSYTSVSEDAVCGALSVPFCALDVAKGVGGVVNIADQHYLRADGDIERPGVGVRETGSAVYGEADGTRFGPDAARKIRYGVGAPLGRDAELGS